MSVLKKTAAIFFICQAIFSANAHAEIKPTGRQTTLSPSRLRVSPLNQDIRRTTDPSSMKLADAKVSALNVGINPIVYGNSVVTLGSVANTIEMEPDTTQTVSVSIDKNGYTGNLYFATVYETDFSDPASVAAQQHISATVISNSPENANGSPYTTPTVQIQITVAPTAAPGTAANFKLMGHNVATNQTIAPRFFTVSVIPSTTVNNVVDCLFAPLDGTDPMYTNGWATINSSFAVFDANGNGVLDSAGGNNNTPFPAFPTAFGGTTSGRAYASPNGDTANIVVSGVFNGDQFFCLHLKAADNGSLYPVMAMVGDLGTGEIMIQDALGWIFDINGFLPSNGQAGSIGGYLTFTPFHYNGNTNELLGNTVSIYFDMSLLPDAP